MGMPQQFQEHYEKSVFLVKKKGTLQELIENTLLLDPHPQNLFLQNMIN